ncbi:MAG: B12-binding domain-containing radical SAM protein [Candidatus Hodarchaeota archaeon]
MKIIMIYPRWKRLLEGQDIIHEGEPGYFISSYKMAGLALPILAALTPNDIELKIIDDFIEPIDFEEPVDLVAITAFTPQAIRAYKIAHEFRLRGIPVVLGGKHPTILPEEASSHADHVIIGEAEYTWIQFLKDFQKGEALPIYKFPENLDKDIWIIPNRRLINKRGYNMNVALLQTIKGCCMKCEGCTLPPTEGTSFRFKPLELVKREIDHIRAKVIYLIDDTLLSGMHDNKYIRDFLYFIKPLKKRFIFNSTPQFLMRNMDYISDFVQAGLDTTYLIMGMHSIITPMEVRIKEYEREIEIYDFIQVLKSYGVSVFLTIFLGFDHQGPEIFEKVVQFAKNMKVDCCEFTLATPFPGTPFYERLKREGRLLHTDWQRYNCGQVVFRPKLMDPDTLIKGYLWAWKEFYRDIDIQKLNNFEIEKIGKIL